MTNPKPDPMELPYTCPNCGTTTPKPSPRSLGLRGVTHHRPDCESVPGATLPRDVQDKLNADLRELARCRARAEVSARNYVIY